MQRFCNLNIQTIFDLFEVILAAQKKKKKKKSNSNAEIWQIPKI